jgi:hypothetical protein
MDSVASSVFAVLRCCTGPTEIRSPIPRMAGRVCLLMMIGVHADGRKGAVASGLSGS